MTFFVNGTAIAGCGAQTLNQKSGQAQCATNTLSPGLNQITATYSGDSNFTNSASAPLQPPQKVEDFVPSVNFSAGVTPGLVTVTQNYDNTNQLFYQQTITFNAASEFDFANSLALACTVLPVSGSGPSPNCTFGGPNPISFVGTTASTSVVMSASIPGTTVPVGIYAVTIAATDTVTGLMHSASFQVNVANNTLPIVVLPGVPGTTQISFVSAVSTNITFSCPTVAGSGVNNGITCNSFTPPNVGVSTTPTSVTLTIGSGSTSAQMRTAPRILATLWLGMPAVVLIGSLRFGKPSRKKLLQLLGILVVLVALLQGIGCGGGFTQPPKSNIPTGSYNLLVVGTDTATGIVQTSAVVPVNVGQ